jgi:hypothetical protein
VVMIPINDKHAMQLSIHLQAKVQVEQLKDK